MTRVLSVTVDVDSNDASQALEEYVGDFRFFLEDSGVLVIAAAPVPGLEHQYVAAYAPGYWAKVLVEDRSDG